MIYLDLKSIIISVSIVLILNVYPD